jgi:hypothetical protein
MYRHPSRQREFFGLSTTLNSGWTHSVIALAVADSGFFVVKGYVEISADDKVAELKKVVLPVLVLPIIPIFIGTVRIAVYAIYLY